MSAEFDTYAGQYADNLKDPLRDAFASDSAFFTRRKLSLIQDFFRRHGQDTSQLHWMDLGCGQGELLRMGRLWFAGVAGCDPSSGMIAHCTDLDVRNQEVPDRIPFGDESFDLVTAACVYHHVKLPKRPALTQEVMRVLKPGGVFCILEHNPFNPITQLIVRRSPVDVHARLITARATAALLRGTRAAVIEVRYFLYFPERLYRTLAPTEDYLSRIPLGGQFAIWGRKSERAAPATARQLPAT